MAYKLLLAFVMGALLAPVVVTAENQTQYTDTDLQEIIKSSGPWAKWCRNETCGDLIQDPTSRKEKETCALGSLAFYIVSESKMGLQKEMERILNLTMDLLFKDGSCPEKSTSPSTTTTTPAPTLPSTATPAPTSTTTTNKAEITNSTADSTPVLSLGPKNDNDTKNETDPAAGNDVQKAKGAEDTSASHLYWSIPLIIVALVGLGVGGYFIHRRAKKAGYMQSGKLNGDSSAKGTTEGV